MDIIQDIIPKGRITRPGTKNSCKYITIHETGNKTRGAGAEAHASYIKSINSKTSWHYTVDDKSIYQHLPDNEKSYHTSDKKANESSISIELCVNSDGDFYKTVENAVQLTRELMQKHGIPIDNVVTHKSWTGKNCPARLLESGWDEFVSRCSQATPERIISLEELKAMGYSGIKW